MEWGGLDLRGQSAHACLFLSWLSLLVNTTSLNNPLGHKLAPMVKLMAVIHFSLACLFLSWLSLLVNTTSLNNALCYQLAPVVKLTVVIHFSLAMFVPTEKSSVLTIRVLTFIPYEYASSTIHSSGWLQQLLAHQCILEDLRVKNRNPSDPPLPQMCIV